MYRYNLSRTWSRHQSAPRLLWIMLNPSTADEDNDDATIRRCIDFSRRWGFSGLDVVNLLAIRTTKPSAIHAEPDPSSRRIREAIAGNVCRCTGYTKIVEAIETAARRMVETPACAAGAEALFE